MKYEEVHVSVIESLVGFSLFEY